MCLRQAVIWLKFEPIGYGKALRIAILVNGVALMIAVAISINYAYGSGMFSEQSSRDWRTRTFAFSPILHLYQIVLFLFIAAAIFYRLLALDDPDKSSETPLKFVDCFALSAVYLGLSIAAALIAGAAIGITLFVIYSGF